MAILPRNLLKSFFEKGDKPNQSQFASLIDSMLHSTEDQVRLGLSTYVPERTYRIGEATIYNGILLYAIVNTTGAFNPLHWQKVFALGSVTYQGTWDAQTNTPTLVSSVGNKGDYYVVSADGTTNINGITAWIAGDWIIYNGSSWERVINADEDNQVAAEVSYSNISSGLISVDVQAAIDEVEQRLQVNEANLSALVTTDVPEGTNLYYTDDRFDARLAAKTTDNITEGAANKYYTEARFDTSLAAKSTTNVAEGTNLYYTDSRFDTRLGTKTTDDITEGTSNKYYTEARFDTSLAAKSTTNVAEGTNLYYTDARFDARLGAKTTDSLTEGTVNKYYTDARFDSRLAVKSTSDLTEGSNLYYTEARVSANTNVSANTSARHTHSNSAVLNAITNAGSGAIITDAERTKLAAIESGATGDQVASEVPVVAAGNLTALNVQAALEELQTEIDSSKIGIVDFTFQSIYSPSTSSSTWVRVPIQIIPPAAADAYPGTVTVKARICVDYLVATGTTAEIGLLNYTEYSGTIVPVTGSIASLPNTAGTWQSLITAEFTITPGKSYSLVIQRVSGNGSIQVEGASIIFKYQ